LAIRGTTMIDHLDDVVLARKGPRGERRDAAGPNSLNQAPAR
jgi:hypothetical protein